MTWGTYFRNALAQYRQPDTYIPLIFLFGAYLITARFGSVVLSSGSTSTAFIWPPAGIALAMLVLFGYRMWPAVFAAALVNALIIGTVPPIVIVASALGNTIQAVVGTFVLRWLDFRPAMNRLRDTFAIMLTALTVTTIVPTIGMAAFAIVGTLPRVTNWGSWWAGEILSILIVTPLMVCWAAYPWFTTRGLRKWTEALIALGVLGCIDVVLFWTDYQLQVGFPLVYLMLIPLIWIALRLGPQIMTLALAMTTAIGVWGTISHFPITSSQSLGQRLFLVEIFMEIIAAIFLILVSLVEERKEAMKELGRQVSQLEDALSRIRSEDRAKTEFLAILAHELRNPLAPVLSSLELMKLEGSHSNHTKELINTMNDRVHAMTRILDDLLDISRITQKKFTLEKKVVDLDTVLDASIATVDVLMRQRNHTFVVHRPGEKIFLEADAGRFEQIVVNLLTNAAKYTPPGGNIVLTAEKEKNTLVIVVRDNGIGIESRMIERIFEPFIQIEGSERDSKSTGLGIGLSLTKQLIEMHGGSISAHSAGLRKGSEFTVTMPLTHVTAPSVEPVPQSPTQPATNSQTLSILVVDDNEAAARGLQKLLEHVGHRVSVAFDGRGALHCISTDTPDVVLLDIGLPDMDGYAVARLIQHAITPTPTLIALTGYGQQGDKAKAQAAGFSYHLTKPVGIADLQSVLAKIPQARAGNTG